jgi:hypothetical protein
VELIAISLGIIAVVFSTLQHLYKKLLDSRTGKFGLVKLTTDIPKRLPLARDRDCRRNRGNGRCFLQDDVSRLSLLGRRLSDHAATRK